jgi:peptidoglycan/xylan/chitin deacetylase (PgdA/CDA1 family)
MAEKIVALKVDVDTYAGTRDGVPALLADMERFRAQATFYFSLGPDNSGKAIRRIFTRKGFLAKMLRTRAPSAYGVRTMLYGTLLPAPMIGAGLAEQMRMVEQQGHEAGIHCWDHVRWHDYLPRFSRTETSGELERAATLFGEIFGHRARTMAAPGWTVSPDSLELQDNMGLDYCSDSRGRDPFYPVMAGRRSTTLQIPTTLATADEILGQNGITPETLPEYYLDSLKEGLNVLTIHAELEGGAIRRSFVALLERLSARGIRCVTLREVAAMAGNAPDSFLYMGELTGRAGQVALQGEVIS